MTPMHPGHPAASDDGGATITTVWHAAGVATPSASFIVFLAGLVVIAFLVGALWLDYRRISAELERYRGQQ
jgi:hypothetical protein